MSEQTDTHLSVCLLAHVLYMSVIPYVTFKNIVDAWTDSFSISKSLVIFKTFEILEDFFRKGYKKE